jgi:hypothetical protein
MKNSLVLQQEETIAKDKETIEKLNKTITERKMFLAIFLIY